MDDVDFTVLAAKSVFSDMIDKCPPAETCRDAFDRTAKATIKMVSSTGGFGTPTKPRRRARRSNTTTTNPTSAPEDSRRRNASTQHQPPFQFDLSLSDDLTPPNLSVATDMAPQGSPAMSKGKGVDTDTYMSQPQGSLASSPGTGSMDLTLANTPPLLRPVTMKQSPGGGGNTFMGQQFGLQGAVDYPDAPTREFLQNIGVSPNGEFSGGGGFDQAQMDLGFGINWEGLGNDYGDGQQMNPFDSFYFGPQQSGSGSGAGGMGGGL